MKILLQPTIGAATGTAGSVTVRQTNYGMVASAKARGKTYITGPTQCAQEAYALPRPSNQTKGDYFGYSNLAGSSTQGISALLDEATKIVNGMSLQQLMIYVKAATSNLRWQPLDTTRTPRQLYEFQNKVPLPTLKQMLVWQARESVFNELALTNQVRGMNDLLGGLAIAMGAMLYATVKQQIEITLAAKTLQRYDGHYWPILDDNGAVKLVPVAYPTPPPQRKIDDGDFMFGYVNIGQKWIRTDHLPWSPDELGYPMPKRNWRGPLNFGPVSLGEINIAKYFPHGSTILTPPPLSIPPNESWVKPVWLSLGFGSQHYANWTCGPPTALTFRAGAPP